MALRGDPARPLIVGRAAELARFAAELEAATPRLLLVSVQAGHGQTTFLRAAAAAAAARGWDALVQDDRGEFTITPAVARDELVARIRAGLGIPAPDALPAGGGDFVAAATPQPAGDRDVAREPCVEQLRRRPGKALLVIDGYRPSPRFDSWFRTEFIAEMLRHDVACTVVVADVAGALNTLDPLPHASVELGPLRSDDVERFFAELRDAADPPLGDREIEVFVEESVVRPELLAALNRLLRLPATPRTRPAAPIAQSGAVP